VDRILSEQRVSQLNNNCGLILALLHHTYSLPQYFARVGNGIVRWASTHFALAAVNTAGSAENTSY
jgi:hypothetical protein